MRHAHGALLRTQMAKGISGRQRGRDECLHCERFVESLKPPPLREILGDCGSFVTYVRFGSKADVMPTNANVCLVPTADKLPKQAAAVAAGQFTTYKLRFQVVATGRRLCMARCCCSC